MTKIGLVSAAVFFVTFAFAMTQKIKMADAAAGCSFEGTIYGTGEQACQAGLVYICSNSGSANMTLAFTGHR